jgi:hypothetical protein
MLEKVADFRRRNPEAWAKLVPYYQRLRESDDPVVVQQLSVGVPLAKIELPPGWPLHLQSTTPADAEMVEYLKHHFFDLEARLQFVGERLQELRGTARPVPCTHCGRGRLHLVAAGAGNGSPALHRSATTGGSGGDRPT